MDFAEFRNAKAYVGDIPPYGQLFQRSLSVGALRDFSEADQQGNLSTSELVTKVIVALVSTADDAPLSDEQVRALDANVRHTLVQAIIEKNREQFVEDRNEEGRGVDFAKLAMPMEQRENESDEEFLVRGIRAEVAAGKAWKSTLSGLSERMQGVLGPGLHANAEASHNLSQMLNSMSLGPRRSDLLDLPRNPVLKTNEILTEVASQIGEMRNLAGLTAKMQGALNDMAQAAVIDFSKGAEDSRKAADEGLEIARRSLRATVVAAWIAVIALIFSVVTTYRQVGDAEARETALRAQTARLMNTEAELLRKMKDLREEVKDIRVEAGAKRTAGEKTTGLRSEKRPSN